MEYPKLRWPIESRTLSLDGQDVIVLECPLGLIEKPLILVHAIMPILASLNGTVSQKQLLERYAPMGLTAQHLSELLLLLDDSLFLDNQHFVDASTKMRSTYARAPSRLPVFQGICYEQDPSRLQHYLDGTLSLVPPTDLYTAPPLIGIVSPHIDYQRGSQGYAEAFKQLNEVQNTTALLIGTSHRYSEHLFHLTTKDFITPLGVINNNREFSKNLIARYGPLRGLSDEYLHKKEHSLELQTPYLKYLSPSLQIVPVLVGSFHHFITKNSAPQTHDVYESFLGALTETTKRHRQDNGKFMVIAGVDMAHVGPQFGDKELTPAIMEEVKDRDREYLEALLTLDKTRLFKHLTSDNDKRRLCGFPTMYTVLDLFERLEIKPQAALKGYHQAVDYTSGCAVTFASLEYRH